MFVRELRCSIDLLLLSLATSRLFDLLTAAASLIELRYVIMWFFFSDLCFLEFDTLIADDDWVIYAFDFLNLRSYIFI